ncbi:MAG: glycine--tRNA ligase subunit beta, partial [Methylocystaceae bacterium]
MSRDLLLEIGLEEMPSAYMPDGLKNLEEMASNRLTEARLQYAAIKVYGTPRRLCLIVEDLAPLQADALIENRGPRRDKAFNTDGTLTKAGEGFARGQKISPEQLEIREQGGIEYIFAIRKEVGQPTTGVLTTLLPDLIKSLPFPKAMRWGYHEMRFPRPIRWLVALYAGQILDLALENVVAGNTTYGHRFLAPQEITVNSVESYLEALAEAYVIVDQNERRAMIWRQVREVATAQGGTAMENTDLLEEVNYLVEYPAAFYGSFSPAYLEVPVPVLTTTMIENQRYFPVFSPSGGLMPGFIGIRNGLADNNLPVVRAGNERVLRARLEDAHFFYREDLKEPLANRVARLGAVTYHERLGSVLDKVNRLEELAAFIAGQLGFAGEENVRRAAHLCKADLVTGMVFEFTELQGIMGRDYALKNGENPEVATAIFEHYLPRFAGDELPTSQAGIALSLAEKFDNLVAAFSIGIKPTGSQDPYALRRQALGIVNIIWRQGLKLPLSLVIRQAYRLLSQVKTDLTEEQTITEVEEFINLRVKGLLTEEGIAYDVVDAILKVPGHDLLALRERALAVAAFKTAPQFTDFMVVFNRSANLSAKAEHNQVNATVFQT